jgi:hypothetical protein
MFQGKTLVELLRLTLERLQEDTVSGMDAQLPMRIVGWFFSPTAQCCASHSAACPSAWPS